MLRRPPQGVTAWLDAAGRHPLVTPAEELHLGTLIRQWQDHPAGPDGAPPGVRRRGLRARERMVCGNLRLVAAVAARRGMGGHAEDRLQAGCLGLIRAAEKFDPARGYKFSTYAFFWIRQAIAKEADRSATVHVPGLVAAQLRGDPARMDPDRRRDGLNALSVLSLEATSCEDGEPLGNLVPGGELTTDHLAAAELAALALEAMRQADPDAAALLELAGDGARLVELAHLEGTHCNGIARRLREARARLRNLPEVGEAMGA